MTTTQGRLQTLWESLKEPREVTFVIVLVYSVCAFMACIFIFAPELATFGIVSPFIHFIMVALMFFGGVIGAPAAWLGKNWLEAPATMAISGALVILMISIGMIATSAIPLLILFGVISLGLLVTRFLRVRVSPFAAGRGPLLPSDELMLSEMQESLADDTNR